jgi:site-specific DNA-methyltransferase (adenine-specific)
VIDISKKDLVLLGDNLWVLEQLDGSSVDVIYIDPPFNTGKVQRGESIKTVRSETGSRKGFKGDTYESIRQSSTSNNDPFEDYWASLGPRLEQA